MAGKTKYGPKAHRRAFELYRELGSFYAVSQQKGMPSHQTLLRWAQPDYNCSCGFHGWDQLEKEIRKEVRARHVRENGQDGQNEDSAPELEKYVRADLDKLKINRLIEQVALKAIRESIEPPKTLTEAQRVIYEAWREDRVILGEPEGFKEVLGPLVVVTRGEDAGDSEED